MSIPLNEYNPFSCRECNHFTILATIAVISIGAPFRGLYVIDVNVNVILVNVNVNENVILVNVNENVIPVNE